MSADQAQLLLSRRLPVGAEPVEGGTHFRVWAPKRQRIDVRIGTKLHSLQRESSGHFSGDVDGAAHGTRYNLVLDGTDAFPDPASRFQPEGPHGESQVIDPSLFEWTDATWRGVETHAPVHYEMHVGTFTMEGTFRAAAEQLAYLAQLGIDIVELMPLAEFPGRFGWGYDGVDLFAPFHGYGTPDDLRGFVNRAHREGLGVVLDVVYNHLGPDGNFLPQFSDHYFSRHHKTDWGDGVNFDGDGSDGVREMVLANARHWIAEYHFDGLRLDATQDIQDDSDRHVLAEIGAAAREAAGNRRLLIVAENERQETRLVRPLQSNGYGLDQLWCDDFHHSAIVAATGRREAYYTDYVGAPQEFVSALKHGFLYQGQNYRWQENRRGSPAWDLDRHRAVFYLENHDQVANSRDGRRLHQITSPGRYRALTAVLLLAQQSPLLFQGEEFGSSRPFLYFADHHPELATLVRKGRSEFLSQFPSLSGSRVARELADPGADETFERSRLDFSERERHATHVALHRDLIALRHSDPVIGEVGARLDGAVIGAHAFVIRYFGESGDRLLVVNLGGDLALDVVPEPLLAPPSADRGWRRLWHSDDPKYGGRAAPAPESDVGTWSIPAESATLLGADA